MKRIVTCLLTSVLLLAGCATNRTESRDESETMTTTGLSPADLKRFSQLSVFFGHQSVGNNILHGIDLMYAEAGTAAPVVVETTQAPAKPAFIAHELVGVNGDPTSKITEFGSIMSDGMADRVGVAALKLCYDDIRTGTDVNVVFEQYSAAMDRIVREHPQLRVIYTTVPLNTAPSWKNRLKSIARRETPPYISDNIVREQYNALVRRKYEASGRLFDIARVESTTTSGQRDSAEHEGQTYYMLTADLAIDGGHLNDKGSKLAAEEFVRVAVG